MKTFFIFALMSASAFAQDHIRISVLPPLIPLDWTTPRTVFMTAFKNRWEDGGRPFGHVYTEITCEGKTLTTSTKSLDFSPISEFLHGRGLGIFFTTWPGDLESGDRLARELSNRKKEGRLLFIDYAVNSSHCKRMMNYYEEFKSLKVARSYGLPHRPRFAEGSSDASFAVSFLEVAGVLNELQREEWMRTVNIPLDYAGPPLKDETANFIRVLFGATEWATGKIPFRGLSFVDPQRMYDWVVREMRAKRFVCADTTSKGVCLDATQLPVQHGSVWLQHTDPMYQKKDSVPKQ